METDGNNSIKKPIEATIILCDLVLRGMTKEKLVFVAETKQIKKRIAQSNKIKETIDAFF